MREFDLQKALDAAIWSLARQDGYIIVTKDDDFVQMSAVHGGPPKVLHLRIGNSPTSAVVDLIQVHQDMIKS